MFKSCEQLVYSYRENHVGSFPQLSPHGSGQLLYAASNPHVRPNYTQNPQVFSAVLCTAFKAAFQVLRTQLYTLSPPPIMTTTTYINNK